MTLTVEVMPCRLCGCTGERRSIFINGSPGERVETCSKCDGLGGVLIIKVSDDEPSSAGGPDADVSGVAVTDNQMEESK